MRAALLSIPLLLPGPAPRPVDETKPPVAISDEALAEARGLFAKLGERLAKVKIARARYEQRRTSELLDEPVVTKGMLFLRREPGCVVFHATEPREAWVRADRTTHQVYYPQLRRAHRLNFDRNEVASGLLDAFFGDLAALETVFAIAGVDGPVEARRIRLEPRDEELAKFVAVLELTLRPKDVTLLGLAHASSRGDRVELLFEELALDPKLDAGAIFRNDLPDGVRIDVQRLETKR